jgi:hypothetical protein
MRRQELEARVLDLLDRVERGQPVEDSTVELKMAWPVDTRRTARQIAGHANAARGDRILWIIGADEGGRRVVSADEQELANWWPAVAQHFDGVTPALVSNLAVPRDSVTVVALLFDTTRAPFVVRTGTEPALEVPWRRGNSTRTARREDLLRLLVPTFRRPSIEVLAAQVQVQPGQKTHLSAALYVVASAPVWFVFHRSSAELRCGEIVLTAHSVDIHSQRAENRPSTTVRASSSEVGIDGPAKLWVKADLPIDGALPADAPHLEAELNLGTEQDGESVRVELFLTCRSPGNWTLAEHGE